MISNADAVLHRLEDLALTCGPPDFIPPEVRGLAWYGHTPESLTMAWEDFTTAVELRAALDGGLIHWTEVYDPEVCRGHDHAIDLKSAEIDNAYRALRWGGGI